VNAGRALARQGYGISLVDASELMHLLGIYNLQLPTLDRLDQNTRRAIIESNRRLEDV